MLSYANIEVKKIHRERDGKFVFLGASTNSIFITEGSGLPFSQYSAIGYIRLIYRQISHQTIMLLLGVFLHRYLIQVYRLYIRLGLNA